MFEWFSTVFSNNSDIARLIAIVISSIVATTLLLVTQYFTNKRTRKELILGKIEKLYNSIDDYGVCGLQYLNSIFDTNDKEGYDTSSRDEALEHAKHCEMITNLYLQEFDYPYDYYASILFMLAKKASTEKSGDFAEDVGLHQSIYSEFEFDIVKLKRKCSELSRKYMH